MAGSVMVYLLGNKYGARVIQKDVITGNLECVEHGTMIWEHIQRAMAEKSESCFLWLDMANTYGSVSHQLLWLAMERFHVSQNITSKLKRYF